MDLFSNKNSHLDSYYLVNGNGSLCTQFVRRSYDSISFFDLISCEIKWFGCGDEFFHFFKTENGGKPDQLIELDFDCFKDFLVTILCIEDCISTLN